MLRRVPVPTRDQMAEQHRAAFDELTAVRGRLPTTGILSVTAHSPEIALAINRLSDSLGDSTVLSDKFRRLAFLIAARSVDCQLIWNGQALLGRQSGLGDSLVDALRDRKPLPPLAADEAAVVNFGLELTETNQVSQETFQGALDVLSVQGLTEFTTAIGYTRMLALNANAFTIDLPD